jgi:UDP-glucuronate 4-epimerase
MSFYGATKYSNEILAKSLSISSKTKFRGMRFFTVYGPMGRPDMAYFRLIHCALNNRKFELYGDGSIRRDFTFISDVITSIRLLGAELEKKTPGHSDVVNVGGGKPNSMNELIACISEITEKKIEILRADSAVGDVRETVADQTLQNKLTGFIPKVSLEKGIQATIEWAQLPEIQTHLGLWIK